ncbi:hypothetical protein G6681_05540 [Polynucleobacter paneuropaeus]|nr:hypothetical protein G6681_05540 [Polynucleobacter paneuropaeus]
MTGYWKHAALILLIVLGAAGCDSQDKSPNHKTSEALTSPAKEKANEAPAPTVTAKSEEAQKADAGQVKKDSHSGEGGSISTPVIFIGIILLLLATNVLTLLVTKGLFKWRKVVAGGMNAIVPSQLLSDFDKMKSDQSKQGSSINENMKRIAEYLGGTSESISILKKELEGKEVELARLRDFQDSSEREMLIKKVVRLHSLLTRIEHHVSSGGINNASAIDFISEELADIFVDFGIQVISPSIGQKASDFSSEALSIASFNPTNNQQTHLTISQVDDVGYLYTPLSGGSKVLKPAVVILNKFGE